LVLLAVVLIVALVSVALLGFFPGMASDAQIAQSKAYWSSASPIAITDFGSRFIRSNGGIYGYIFFRNVGAYPIRITGIIGADGGKITGFYADGSGTGCLALGIHNISDYYYMAPGEEKYFASSFVHGGSYCRRHIEFSTGASWSGYVVGGASSVCQNSSSSPGMISFNTFGFEYIEYIDRQQITKRQIGI